MPGCDPVGPGSTPGDHPKRRWQSGNAAVRKTVAHRAAVVRSHPGALTCLQQGNKASGNGITAVPPAERPFAPGPATGCPLYGLPSRGRHLAGALMGDGGTGRPARLWSGTFPGSTPGRPTHACLVVKAASIREPDRCAMINA
jgi:hypothetical protein